MAVEDVKFANNVTVSLTAPITSGQTSITVSSSVGVPSLTPPEYFFATIEDYANGFIEIIKVTARSGATWTVERGQEGTTARAFSTDTVIVQLRLTAKHMQDIWDNISGSGVPEYLRVGTAPASLGTAAQVFAVNPGATAPEWKTIVEGDLVPDYLEDGNAPASIGASFTHMFVTGGVLVFTPLIYDLVLGFGGTYTASEELVRFTAVRGFTLPASLTGSKGSCRVGPTSTSVVLSLKKNGVEFGTVTFAAAATTCTFSAASSTSFVEGDYLTLVAPAGLNESFVDVGITLRGTRSGDSGGAP